MPTHLIVLAAGEGTRMASETPKVLHEIGGAPMIAHALGTVASEDGGKSAVVVGSGAETVSDAIRSIDPEVAIFEQVERLGTAHAVLAAKEFLASVSGDVAIVNGDNPLVTPETINRMIEARKNGADLAVVGFHVHRPNRYGHMLHDGDRLVKIVEWKDANDEERAVTLCNAGIYLADAETLLKLICKVSNDNAAGEYYLTDIVEIAANDGLIGASVTCDESEALGINSRAELAAAEAAFQQKTRAKALGEGVTMVAPETVFFSHDTHIGRDALIEPNVVFGPGVTVETNARIRAFSHLEGCHVGAGAVVGPYARLRPGTELSNNVKIGNFVEIKNAEIRDGAKVNHLSYVGDAEIGAETNVGAGTITCNYDGVFKHRTKIGERVFIGSNTMLVAPVSVGDDAMTATGTTVTRDVPAGDLAIARAKQENKAGFAKKLFERLRATKARLKG